MTRDDLEQIYYLNRELKIWEREFERLRGQSLVRSPVPNAVRGSGVADKVGDRAERVIALEEKIATKRAELQTVRNTALEFIFAIPDSLTRQIIYYRCVECMSWRRVAAQVGGDNTKDSVRMTYKRFLEKL